jgi:hypothetical protein
MQMEEKQGLEGTRGTSSRAGRCMVTFIQAMVGDRGQQSVVPEAGGWWLVPVPATHFRLTPASPIFPGTRQSLSPAQAISRDYHDTQHGVLGA